MSRAQVVALDGCSVFLSVKATADEMGTLYFTSSVMYYDGHGLFSNVYNVFLFALCYTELLNLVRDTENDEITTVIQKMVVKYQDDVQPIAVDMVNHLANIFKQVCVFQISNLCVLFLYFFRFYFNRCLSTH